MATKVILTHPCAGKTYTAKQNPNLGDLHTKGKSDKEVVMVTFGHDHYKEYDAAVALPDDKLKELFEYRRRQSNKKWTSLPAIMYYRDEVIRYAEKKGIPVYNSLKEAI